MKGFLTAPSPVETNYLPRELLVRDLADEGAFSIRFSSADNRYESLLNGDRVRELSRFISKSDFGKKIESLGEMSWTQLLINMFDLLDKRQDLSLYRKKFRGYLLKLKFEKNGVSRQLQFSWERARNF